MDIQRIETSARMSKAVVYSNTVYLAGIVAESPTEDVADETRQVLAEIDRLLRAAGTDKSRILSALLWVSDIRHYSSMNAVWDAWIPPDAAPARACVQAPLARPAARVEIMVTAALL